MEESFPKEVPKVGGDIFASDMKTVYDTVRKVNRMRIEGGRFVAPTNIVEVIAEVTDSADDAIPGVYTCAVRYYNGVGAADNEGVWTTMVNADDDPKTWLLDGSDVGVLLNPRTGAEDGQIISAWWNPQRGAFIPIVAAVVRFAWATTAVAVDMGDATFTVDAIVPMDGSTWGGDDPLTVKNSPDRFSINENVTGKIIYCKDPTGDDWSWRPYDFSCCSDCECECSS